LRPTTAWLGIDLEIFLTPTFNFDVTHRPTMVIRHPGVILPHPNPTRNRRIRTAQRSSLAADAFVAVGKRPFVISLERSNNYSSRFVAARGHFLNDRYPRRFPFFPCPSRGIPSPRRYFDSTTSPVTIEKDPANQFPTGSQQVPNRFRTDSAHMLSDSF
jgi:hypothetical protein